MSSLTSPGVQRVPTDSGTALPSGGTLNFVGAGGITTSAVGDTVTITGSGGGGVTSLTGNTGGALTGALNLIGAGILSVAGSGSTLTISMTNPVPIANGGTNATSMATTFGVNYFDGTRLVTTAVGTATHVLTSNGAGVAPTFQALPASGIGTIAGDSGTATGSTVTFNAATQAGATVNFSATGSTVSLNATDASNNTIIGLLAGEDATLAGSGNTALGWQAARFLTSGNNNTCIGRSAGVEIQSGSSNTIIGSSSGTILSTGSNNTIVGHTSFPGEGSSNIVVGYNSFSGATTGGNNLIIGTQSGNSYVGAEASNILLQNAGVAAESNVMRLGTTGSGTRQVSTTYIAGIAGVSVSNNSVALMDTTTGQLGTVVGSALSLNTGTNALNISTDASATTIAIGTGAAVKTLTIGSTNSTSSTTINFGGSTGGALSTYIAPTTFTPTLTFGGGSTGITYAVNVGRYERIGDVIIFSIDLQLSNKGSSTGSAAVAGMPVAAGRTSIFVTSSNAITATGAITGRITVTGTTINIDQINAGTGARSAVTDTSFSNSSFIQISGTYFSS